MLHYIPRYFELYELLPPDIYALYKHKGISLWNICFDARVLYTIDRLRARCGVAIANDWHWGGIHKERGLRAFYTLTGTALSQHKFGRAVDLKFRDVAAKEVRKEIIVDADHDDFKYITCVETGVDWLHFDVRNWDKKNHGLLRVMK